MKEKGPFCISVTNIRGITKKFGPKTAEVNDLRENPPLAVENVNLLFTFTANVTPGPDHVISRGLRFAVNVKLNVSITYLRQPLSKRAKIRYGLNLWSNLKSEKV